MAFAARILTIAAEAGVPNSDRLSVFRVLGYDAVSANEDDGSRRFHAGERVVYVPEGSRIPEALLREHGFWGPNPETGAIQGTLSGPAGDVVKPVTLRGMLSTGLIWKLPAELAHLPEGSEVSDHYGITEWIPPIPDHLLAASMHLSEMRFEYEIGRYKTYQHLLAQDHVVLTEKLEGENIQMVWMGDDRIPGLHAGGAVAITTKGMARQGKVFRDATESEGVPIIRAVRRAALLPAFDTLVDALGARGQRVRLMAEAIGRGVKKLHYGEATPTARAFDIMVGQRWLPEDERAEALARAGIARVPVLWRGMFDPEVIEHYRQGDTTVGGAHIREGVVINAVGEQDVRFTELNDRARPMLKTHSDPFLKKFGKDD